VSLNICGTTLTFINSHLAAHQGKALQRNADVAEITDELFRGRVGATAVGQEGDAVTTATHVVWMGDLNYRIDFGEQVSGLWAVCGWRKLMLGVCVVVHYCMHYVQPLRPGLCACGF
jgi:hypothetical protein